MRLCSVANLELSIVHTLTRHNKRRRRKTSFVNSEERCLQAQFPLRPCFKSICLNKMSRKSVEKIRISDHVMNILPQPPEFLLALHQPNFVQFGKFSKCVNQMLSRMTLMFQISYNRDRSLPLPTRSINAYLLLRGRSRSHYRGGRR